MFYREINISRKLIERPELLTVDSPVATFSHPGKSRSRVQGPEAGLLILLQGLPPRTHLSQAPVASSPVGAISDPKHESSFHSASVVKNP